MIAGVGTLLSQSQIQPAQSIVDRAEELARDGLCPSVNHVRQTLIREGYTNVGAELKGQSINAKLVTLIRQSSVSPLRTEVTKR